jgi:hypothetical protein
MTGEAGEEGAFMTGVADISSLELRQLDREWVALEAGSVEEVARLISDPERLVSLDIEYQPGLTEQLLASVKERCPELDGLIPERAARPERDPTKRPPKTKAFRGFVFARMYWLEVVGSPRRDQDQDLVAQELHLIAGPSFAITIRYPCLAWNLSKLIREGPKFPRPAARSGLDLAQVRQGVRELRDRIDPADPRGVFGLEVASSLVDTVIDSVFDSMQDLRETADEMERWVLDKKAWLWDRKEWPKLDRRVLGLRRLLRQVRWAFMPTDELAEVGSGPFLHVVERDAGLRFKLEDLGREADRANHAVADLIDQVEHTVALRDSIKTDRLNATTYALTIIATVLLVPTLIAGIYGMNFDRMPELRWRTGYFMTLGLMVVLATGVWLTIRYALRRVDLRHEESEPVADRSRRGEGAQQLSAPEET